MRTLNKIHKIERDMVKKVDIFKNDFNFLMDISAIKNAFRNIVIKTLNCLVTNDPLQKTRFEYSLQIKDFRLDQGLRFVNYDTHYLCHEEDTYLKRINLIEQLSTSICKGTLALGPFFSIIKNLSFSHLPLYFGIGLRGNKDLLLKLYLNFFSHYRENPILAHQMITYIANELNLPMKIKKREVALIGLTLSERGIISNYKVYYLYKKNYCPSGFTSREMKTLHWLNRYNRLSYFDIMERYKTKKNISRKIEIHPHKNKNFLSLFCEKSGNKSLFSKINYIIEMTNGKIEAIGIEKDTLTVYITMKNYGHPQILL